MKRKPLEKLPRAGAVAACVVMALFFTFTAQALGWWRMPGVRVAGVAREEQGRITRAVLERTARTWSAQTLMLTVGYQRFTPTHGELGWALRVADAERELAQASGSWNPIVWLHGLWVGLFGAGHELPWRPRMEEPAALDRYVDGLRFQIDRLPIPGSYGPDGTPIDGLPGEALDVGLVRREVERALARGADKLELTTSVTPAPRIYRRFDRPQDEARVLMFAQETQYRPGTGRAVNIELAARKLDGSLMLPGAPLSFNELVGQRTAARGFAPALELVNGELVDGVGGGVCQVAGTLHAAAFFAGIAVHEYHAHSRLNRFAYLQPGLDAMVAWPDDVRELGETKDMRLRNPYPFPVVVRAQTERAGDHNVLRIALYGSAKPFRVDFQFKLLEREPAGELRRSDIGLAAGETRVKQEGLDGMLIARRRTIYTPLRKVEEETRVAYPPTPRILLVGLGSRVRVSARR